MPKKQKFDNEAVKYDPNEPQDNPVYKYDKRSFFKPSRTTAQFRREAPMDPINVRTRVNLAKRTITGLVAKGTRINLNKASDFTVGEIAKSGAHPQSGAAHGQQTKRGREKVR
jgi:hypothetical protein